MTLNTYYKKSKQKKQSEVILTIIFIITRSDFQRVMYTHITYLRPTTPQSVSQRASSQRIPGVRVCSNYKETGNHSIPSSLW